MNTAAAVRLVVPGEPVPQNVGKIGRWKSRDGREGAVIRQPQKVIRYKLELQERMERALPALSPQPYFSGPVELRIVAVFPLPVSAERKTKPVPRRRHTSRYGNCDNLCKAIADAGEGILWADDGQVAVLYVEKWVGAQGEAARVEITIEALSELTVAEPLNLQPEPLPLFATQETR